MKKRTPFLPILAALVFCIGAHAADRPNILWITSEDNSPDYLGPYGNPHANTPTLDRLAAEGVVYERAYANAAVCGPARTVLITGTYPPTFGGEHMRSQVPLPSQMKIYPQYLREAGYYTTNNSKQDYNIDQNTPGWDESSRNAHWKNRPQGKPFFAIFNTNLTHESCLHPSRHTVEAKVPLDKIRVPAYLPDTETTRERISAYYTRIQEMDSYMADRVKELENAGLLDDTIIFYYSDHGGIMPRSKRFIYDSGTHVPLIVRVPRKWAHLMPHKSGSRTTEIVSFVDFAPTLLSLVGADIPEYMQGRAFLGEKRSPAPEYAYTFRARADERIDFKRGVTDGKYNYIRNYLAYLPTGQRVNYLWDNPATAEWERLFRQGKTNAAQSAFFQPAPLEELFDLEKDPDEVNNLARDPAYRDVLVRMRQANHRQILSTFDTGFIPESLLVEWTRSSGKIPFEISRDRNQYPLLKILNMADALLSGLRDQNPVVQYWALVNCLVLKTEDERALRSIASLTSSPVAANRIAAAEHLARIGKKDPRPVLHDVLVNSPNVMARLHAINALDHVSADYPYDPKVLDLSQAIWPTNNNELKAAPWMGRYKAYDVRVMEFLASTERR